MAVNRVLTTEWPGIVVQLIKKTDQEKDRRTKEKNDLDKCLVNISTIPRPILFLSEFVYMQ